MNDRALRTPAVSGALPLARLAALAVVGKLQPGPMPRWWRADLPGMFLLAVSAYFLAITAEAASEEELVPVSISALAATLVAGGKFAGDVFVTEHHSLDEMSWAGWASFITMLPVTYMLVRQLGAVRTRRPLISTLLAALFFAAFLSMFIIDQQEIATQSE